MIARLFFCLLPLLSFSAVTAATQDPVFTWPAGSTRAEAINVFERKLDATTVGEVSRALAWMARHGELDLNEIEGFSAAQIIAHVRRERMQDQARNAAAEKPPIRITFAEGSTNAAVSGQLPPHGNQHYILALEAGQTLTATATSAGAPVDGEPAVILVIYGKDGTVLMTDHVGSATFTGTIPTSQDYYVEALNEADQPHAFSLKVGAITRKPIAKETVRKAIPVPPADGTDSTPWFARPLKHGQYQWHPKLSTQGPVNVVVSLGQQMAYVYRGGVLIGRSTVSTGRKGHRTPTGVFHILNKDKDHHSKTYNNAPMPYSERLTWGGVALHAGVVPGYPSSHGCIHLPMKFATDLYGITHKGTAVIITNDSVTPARTESDNFVVMASKPEKPVSATPKK